MSEENKPAEPAAPVAAPAAPATPAAPAAPAAKPSILGAVQGADWIPEKFRVKKDDGSVDEIASARKIEEHRAHLERRLGAGDLPPKTADEYTFKAPDQFKEVDLSKDELFGQFRKDALENGITQKQFEFVMNKYFAVIPKLAEAQGGATIEQAQATLAKMWPDEQDRGRQIKLASQAAAGFLPAEYRSDPVLGNHPGFIAAMAAVGAQMQEDQPVSASSGAPGESFDERAARLRDELSKLPQSDKRRAALRGELDSLYSRRYGSKKPMLTGGKTHATA